MSITSIINQKSGQKKETVLILRRRVVEDIAKEFVLECEYKKQEKTKKIEVMPKPGYAEGYKQGYVDRSNEIYDEQVIGRYNEYILKTEIPD